MKRITYHFESAGGGAYERIYIHMESTTVTLIIIVFCIIMSAYFSATETAFSSINRIRVKNMAEKGNSKAALVMKLSENYDSLLSSILIGNNIVNIACASLATVLFVKMLGDDAGASVSTLVTTIVVLIFGEVSPKSIAKESPERFAMLSAPFLNLLVIILTPVNFLFKQWKKLLSLVFKSSEEQGITEEELITMVEEAEQGGGIDRDESMLIRSAIEFNDLEAGDIFTPRIDVVGISAEISKEDAARVFADTGYSRLPVYVENIDHILGILYQKDFHNKVFHSELGIRDVIKPALFITKGKNINDLMKELQQKKLHIAVVMDEYGGTVGIVTLEDILEELVGDIWDEHDEVVREIEQVSEKEFLVSGKTNVEKLFHHLGREQEFEVLTVSGWVMDMLERVPVEGDVCERDGLRAEVLKMDGRRIETVRIMMTK